LKLEDRYRVIDDLGNYSPSSPDDGPVEARRRSRARTSMRSNSSPSSPDDGPVEAMLSTVPGCFQTSPLRRLQTTAPLKLIPRRAGGISFLCSPSSPDDGPVEAQRGHHRRELQRLCALRRLQTTAPLKRRGHAALPQAGGGGLSVVSRRRPR